MNRLRELREEKGWTQEYLGTLLNVKNAAVSKYETGRAALTDETIITLIEFFDVSADYLLGISSERKYKPNLTEDERKVLYYYNRLNDEHKDIAKGDLVTLFKEQQKIGHKDPINYLNSNSTPSENDDITHELESYRQELISKKNNENNLDNLTNKKQA